jgi:hypothetical protein
MTAAAEIRLSRGYGVTGRADLNGRNWLRSPWAVRVIGVISGLESLRYLRFLLLDLPEAPILNRRQQRVRKDSLSRDLKGETRSTRHA